MIWGIIIRFVFFFYIYTSVFVMIRAFYLGRDLDREPILGIKYLNLMFFFFGGLYGLTYFFAAGFERALFFLPESWGDHGDFWYSTKEALSLVLGSFATIGLFYGLEKLNNKIKKKKDFEE